ncbi:hypothetical protein ACFQZZ_22090 [Nocardia sp. GCM10030253]|uniref:hypothetical protein n=1 Tax=Nocardia sp. GCM10030253 TaxID=3273404 RepID=UPI003642AF86
MIILIGLIVLIAAVIIGVAGVAANMGEVSTSTNDFAMFDYHFTADAGQLFGYGAAVGAIGMLGLSLLLTGVWRSSRRGVATRRELRQSRKEVAAVRRSTPPVTPSPPASRPASPPPSGKSVWSWNRFMRQPSGDTPVETVRK